MPAGESSPLRGEHQDTARMTDCNGMTVPDPQESLRSSWGLPIYLKLVLMRARYEPVEALFHGLGTMCR
jgi:hypothetical protein